MNTRTDSPHRVPARWRLLLVASAVSLVLLASAVVLHSVAASSTSVSGERSPVSPSIHSAPETEQRDSGSVGAPGEADGVIHEGDWPTVFDVDRPAVGKLDAELLGALQRAAKDAAKQDLVFRVNSGWRSAALQEQLLRDAVATYGSEEEAARWVATAETSLHVSGDAVDLGPLPTLDWLAQHGARYGLCQIYANESWHYELRPDAVEHGCPATYTDPTEDPRMQR